MKIPYFDAHCDTIWNCTWQEGTKLFRNMGHIDLERGGTLRKYAQIFALYNRPYEIPPDGMLAQTRHMYEVFRREMEENSDLIVQCCTGSQIDDAIKNGKMAAVLSIEGGDLLECAPGNVSLAAGWGVRMINLVWNYGNAISGTNCRETERGLSQQGADFVRELEAHHIYADVSHLSDPGFWDLCRISRQPIVASHSNARSLCPHPRNLTDDQFRAIRDSGGVVGINYYRPFVGHNDGIEALVAHVEHFLELGGEKTVCMGGDMDGCDVLAGGMRGLQDVHKLYEVLQMQGYSEALLEDLFWNNLRRLI